MIETYYAGAYWMGREESATQCAQRASAFFQHLSRCDPLYARWFEQARTRKEALQRQFEPTQATFEAFFAKKYRSQAGGFLFGAWTGHEEGHGGMVLCSCGSGSDVVADSCVLNLPSKNPGQERVVSVPVLAQIVRAMALAWEPDCCEVMSSAYQALLPKRREPHILLGWMTYLPHRRGRVPPLPSPVRVEPVENQGTLIILTPERFTAANPTHVELANHVREVLDRAGLLGPLRP